MNASRTRFFRAASLAILLTSCAALALPSASLRQVAQGLASPTEMVNAHDGSGRLFILEQAGRIRILANGTVAPTPFLDIATLIVSGGEQGLLGLAFHPQYAANGAFYVYYTRKADGTLVVARYLRSAADPDLADAASGAVILAIPHPGQTNHNGGHMAFGADGDLYIGVGDGGGANDQFHNAQNRGVLLGKLLRLAVDGGTGYTIPAGNPYAGSSCGAGTCAEIWAYGLRNPWKFSFDRVTHDLIIGDVGQNNIEEVDFQPAGAIGGTNYGWGVYEGNNCFNDTYFGSAGACAALAGHMHPVITYDHGSSGGVAITGGYRYRGASAALQGYYLYGDYLSKRVWAARPDASGAWTTQLLIAPSPNVSSLSGFGEDEAGEVYLVDLGNGKIWAIDGPPLAGVVSRKDHGAAGPFDLAIDTSQPIGGMLTVEPRVIGSGHLVAFQFSVPVSATGNLSCVDASGSAVGSVSASISGNEVQVTVSGIPEAQRVTLSLADVNGAGINVDASLGFLVGDVNDSRTVSAADILGVKFTSGSVVDATNFRYDLNLTGGISAADILAVKARSGTVMP